MTDETYAVNCTLNDEKNRRDIMFYVALFSRCYWMAGAVAGGILGQLIPYKLEGIDFCMTALFVIILMEQLEKKGNRIPAVIGAVVSVICLLVLGEKTFMPVSMIIISLILMGRSSKEQNGENLNTGIPKLLAVLAVVISYRLKKNTFLSIILGTACYMILITL